MAKTPSSLFFCTSCGNEFSKWAGQCPACKDWNTLTEVKLDKLSRTKNKEVAKSHTPAQALRQVENQTIPTTIGELDRVLGQGLTNGGVYLLAGQPGIGKSTLLTQLALALTQAKNQAVTYICSEENASQVATRINRLATKKHDPESINLLETSSVESIINSITKHPPSLLIVDSIQSIASDALSATSGTISQIRVCSNLLIHLAKSASIPVILVGHVTKGGTIAGPKLLEHMVDVVLELEGDRHHDLRLLRGTKNRFGPTDETGLFQMTSEGLTELKNPGELFLSEQTKSVPGSARTLIMEGSRPLLVEIQALTVHTEIPIPRRVTQGIPIPKLQLICAVLTKHLNLNLNTKDVFVNVTGGLKLVDPAADLAIALAIISSYKNVPLPPNSVAIGELGLLGEIRNVAYVDKRLKEAGNLGFVPVTDLKKLPTLKDLINKIVTKKPFRSKFKPARQS